MTEMIAGLDDFIVQAKAATYIGGGKECVSCRPGSIDLEYRAGSFRYLDSYFFGGSDFIGQEVVYFEDRPVWGMNYYGYILEPERITAAQAGSILKKSLTRLYQQNRFLGGYQDIDGADTYFDTNQGGSSSFSGKEWIEREGVPAYELVYHGGLIK